MVKKVSTMKSSRSILLFLIITIFFVLTGCVKEPVLVNESMLYFSDKEVIDSSDVYTVEEDSMMIYHYLEDDSTSYVDIEEFADFLEGGLLNYNVEKSDALLLEYRQIVPEAVREIIGKDMVIYDITFDHEENTIYTSDLDIFTRLNLVYSISTNDVVTLSQVDRNDVDPMVEIDLDDYGFDILYENDHYYLPLYLANLFLTGASINLYETDDVIVLFDYGTDTSQVREHYTSSSKTLDDVQEATTNYLALYFDYFYGLKEEKEIDSFRTVIEDYGLSEAENFIDYYELISDFMFDLDDLHTRIIDTGYLMPEYEPQDNFLYGSKVNTYSTAYAKNRCGIYPDEFTYTLINSETHLVQLPGFEVDTGDRFAEIVSYIQPGDDLIVDLTCNTGGSLQGVVEILMYMTEEPIPVRHINSKTGQIAEEYYISDVDAVEDYHLFVMTSEVTYSAANVFATIVQDLELGTIIGDNTLGGSCALVFTVLPNGLIISNSSYMTFIDQNLEIKDDGIGVDIQYTLPYEFGTVSEDIQSFFKIGTRYFVDIDDLVIRSRILLDVLYQDEVIDVTEYILTVAIPDGNTVFTGTYVDEFSLRYDFENSIFDYDITIEVVYEYDSISYQEVIYYQEGNPN